MNSPLHVEVSDGAAGQIRVAEAWWRANRPKAPNAIREELERASVLIAVQPDIGASAREVALEGVRRIHLRRIRHYLYFRTLNRRSAIGHAPPGPGHRIAVRDELFRLRHCLRDNLAGRKVDESKAQITRALSEPPKYMRALLEVVPVGTWVVV